MANRKNWLMIVSQGEKNGVFVVSVGGKLFAVKTRSEAKAIEIAINRYDEEALMEELASK